MTGLKKLLNRISGEADWSLTTVRVVERETRAGKESFGLECIAHDSVSGGLREFEIPLSPQRARTIIRYQASQDVDKLHWELTSVMAAVSACGWKFRQPI